MLSVGNPPYKYVDAEGKATHVKVISFPVPKDCPVAGESMWVKVEEGDENNGVGILDNNPVFCTAARLGSRIRYGGGTSKTKAHFLEVLDTNTDKTPAECVNPRQEGVMGKLNAPREIPYEFRVVLHDFVVWLYDDSERTYCCTATPSVWMEALYHFLPEEGAECPGCKSGTISYNEDRDEAACTGECGSIWGLELPDPDYFSEGALQSEQNRAVPLAPDEVAFDVPKKDAWDSAREAANANHLI